MSKILKNYTFKGFGFDVLLKNISVKSIAGEDYPDININELKSITAKMLLTSRQRLTGYHIKFLRTYIQMSYDELSEQIHVPASTLRSWENKGSEFTGLSVNHEKAFRIMAINKILEEEKNKFHIEVALLEEFQTPFPPKALDIASDADSFISNV